MASGMAGFVCSAMSPEIHLCISGTDFPACQPCSPADVLSMTVLALSRSRLTPRSFLRILSNIPGKVLSGLTRVIF